MKRNSLKRFGGVIAGFIVIAAFSIGTYSQTEV